MNQIFRKLLVLGCVLTLSVGSSLAQEQESPRFSHKGVKVALGLGGFNNDFGRELRDGEAASLSLGYGFNDRFTLWLTGVGVEHPQNTVNRSVTDFGGLELNLQYKFMPKNRLQPYAKIGVGVYATGEKNSSLIVQGAGFNLGAGLDFFFSKHFGIGAEVMFKQIEFDKQRVVVSGRDVVTDLPRKIDGESAGFMVTLTIQ